MRLTVIGLGLIGGSLAKDLKESGFAEKIIGIEADPNHSKQALQLGLVDEIQTLDSALKDTQGVILAIPVNQIVALATKILDRLPESAFLTDMGSTKQAVCQSVAKHKKRGQFVASHPMAGTEHSGPTAAISQLFSDKTTVICESDKSNPQALQAVEKLYKSLKMRIIYMTPQSHDLHAAFVSHLSHISSFVLANTVLDKETDTKAIFDLAGGGFESTVRLAKSSPQMWAPIFEQNKQNILEALSNYIEHMKSFRDSIESDDFTTTKSLMERANEIRRVLQSMEKK